MGKGGMGCCYKERLVAAPAGILRREVWSVGLREEAFGGDPGGRVLEGIGAGISQRPGKRDEEAEVEPGRELVGPFAVAVDHPADAGTFAEDGPYALARV